MPSRSSASSASTAIEQRAGDIRRSRDNHSVVLARRRPIRGPRASRHPARRLAAYPGAERIDSGRLVVPPRIHHLLHAVFERAKQRPRRLASCARRPFSCGRPAWRGSGCRTSLPSRRNAAARRVRSACWHRRRKRLKAADRPGGRRPRPEVALHQLADGLVTVHGARRMQQFLRHSQFGAPGETAATARWGPAWWAP